ncbi:hypothetical protein CGZ80_00180 [Rhodopirellula sp. MGV]|nr:hypothetical protein CGZ80_00180 [Rhodopirellula sp. MGV]PNY35522.1 hypothetical protein C2E31_18665 [Rhodopirellula baltica]
MTVVPPNWSLPISLLTAPWHHTNGGRRRLIPATTKFSVDFGRLLPVKVPQIRAVKSLQPDQAVSRVIATTAPPHLNEGEHSTVNMHHR